MDPHSLRTRLAALHEQLARTPAVDSESQRLLRTLLTDIEGVLNRSTPPAPAHEHRIESLATRFEADHPSIAGALRQVLDSLGKAGV